MAVDTHTRLSPHASCCLVTLRGGGQEPPLYLVHPLGGDLAIYRPLLRHLDPRWPVIGLEAVGRRGEGPPDSTIAAMAERYVAWVLARPAPRPFWLGGYSLGGLVALEMARVLQRHGEAVAGVILLDALFRVSLPDGPGAAHYWQLRIGRPPVGPVARFVARLLALPPEHDVVAMLRVAGHELRRLTWQERATYFRGLVGRVVERRSRPRGSAYDWALYRIQIAALLRYWPEPLAVPVLLLWCADDGDADGRAAVLRAWQTCLGEHLVVQGLAGTHQSMAWEPRVGGVAAAMGAFMAANPGGTL